MSEELAKCELCGEPMPPGETMFKFHGYSGPCPKPPLPKKTPVDDPVQFLEQLVTDAQEILGAPYSIEPSSEFKHVDGSPAVVRIVDNVKAVAWLKRVLPENSSSGSGGTDSWGGAVW